MSFVKGNRLWAKRTEGTSTRMSPNEYEKRLAQSNERHGSRNVQPVEKYLGMNVATLHKCNVCDHEWKVRPANLINRLQGCPSSVCRKGKGLIPENVLRERLEKAAGKDYLVLNVERKGTGLSVTIQHKKCGLKWSPSYHNFLKGSSCPDCSRVDVGTQMRWTTNEFIKRTME